MCNRKRIRKVLVREIEFAERLMNSPYILQRDYVCVTNDYLHVLARDWTGFGAKIVPVTADLRFAAFMVFADATELASHWNATHAATDKVDAVHYKDVLRRFVESRRKYLEQFDAALSAT